MQGTFISLYSILLVLFWIATAQAQDQIQVTINEKTQVAKHSLEITTLGFGGTALKFSYVNNQLAIMNGGRGAAVINHRFTVGGGGYGTISRIEVESGSPDTFLSFKMGYGGLELGYLFFPDYKRINAGTSLLIGAGAGFIESLPESRDNPFSIFPVIEPAVYGEASLNRLLKLQIGVTFRYITGRKISNITSGSVSGTSAYINLLFGTCPCESDISGSNHEM